MPRSFLAEALITIEIFEFAIDRILHPLPIPNASANTLAYEEARTDIFV
jgi:hypothetical protein